MAARRVMEVAVTTDQPLQPDEMKAAIAAAYGRGYNAGQRRKRRAINVEARQRREEAMWHRYMAAALGPCVNAQGWKRGEKPITDIPSRTSLAADFADEAVRVARARGRL